MVKIFVVVVVVTLAACGYGASFKDCAVACTSEFACPSELTCSVDIMTCRMPGATGPCPSGQAIDAAESEDANTADATDGDATMGDATPATDGSTAVTLNETAPTTPDQAAEVAEDCTNTPDTQTFDNDWYRVIPLQDPHFALPPGLSGLLVSEVSFSVWRADGTPPARVSIGTYGGTFPTAGNLDGTKLNTLATKTVSIQSTTGSSRSESVLFSPPVLIPVDATTNGKMFVEVYAAAGLQLGSTANRTDWNNGFFQSSCTGAQTKASHGMIITVTGTPQ